MQRLTISLFCLLLGAGSVAMACPCKGEDAATQTDVKAKPGETLATLFVDGMHCGGCSGHVRAALGKVKGVGGVTADFKTGKVVVAYDPKLTNLQAIKAALKEAGYPPRASA